MRLYDLNAMVKADCQDCKGCSSCCRGMGDSIVLDPLDVYHLTKYLGKTFEELLSGYVGLRIEDGIIQPHLQMTAKERCPFLDNQGRCEIHEARPGLCRTFPLGRNYDNGKLTYFLLEDACPQAKIKVKVGKWIDTPDLKQNQEFLIKWHYFMKGLRERAKLQLPDSLKQVNMQVLNLFYVMPYDMGVDFYSQFDARLSAMKE